MSTSRWPQYVPGAIVRISMSIQHRMTVELAHATYRHEEQEGVEIYLQGHPVLDPDQEAYRELNAWRSTVEMFGQIPARAVPGVYSLNRVLLETYDGRGFTYTSKELAEELEEWEPMRLEVLKEPTDKPVIEEIRHR